MGSLGETGNQNEIQIILISLWSLWVGGFGRCIHSGMLDLEVHMELIIFWLSVVKIFLKLFLLLRFFNVS